MSSRTPEQPESTLERIMGALKQEKFPDFDYVLASLDTAYTEKQENDASALSIWGMFKDEAGNPKVMLMHCWEERLSFSNLFWSRPKMPMP